MMKTKNMRWLVLPVLLFVGTGSLSAQSVRQDEQEVLRKTDGGVYNVYDADAPAIVRIRIGKRRRIWRKCINRAS